jgi:DNA ligase-1
MRTLEQFCKFINEINASNGRLHKQSVLKKYKDDPVICKYLQIAFDPYKVYGISTKKLNKIVGARGVYDIETVFDLFDYLEVHNTGTDKDISICQEAIANVNIWNRDAGTILEALICKKLSIGCDAKTINKEIPGLIPTFAIQLANKYFDKPEYVEGTTFAITTKIDGGRIIAIKENGQVTFYTRAGQKYEGLVDLEAEMLEKFPDGVCLDGEITLLNTEGIPSKEAYKQAMKITRADGEKHGVKMLVFDAMLAEEFRAQRCDRIWERRREGLENTFNAQEFNYFQLLPVLYKGEDTTMITKLLDEAIANQQEGIMINLTLAPYEFKRTNYLLKVKKFNSADLRVIGFEEGTGKYVGMLGALICDYKDNVVRVGSGLTDNQRKEIWQNRFKYLDTIVEISYFEETKDSTGKKSLRFPTFKDFRPDKTEPNY